MRFNPSLFSQLHPLPLLQWALAPTSGPQTSGRQALLQRHRRLETKTPPLLDMHFTCSQVEVQNAGLRSRTGEAHSFTVERNEFDQSGRDTLRVPLIAFYTLPSRHACPRSRNPLPPALRPCSAQDSGRASGGRSKRRCKFCLRRRRFGCRRYRRRRNTHL